MPDSDRSNDDLGQRMHNVEAAVEALRSVTGNLERELALIGADLERLRPESERAVGSRLP
jgi:hypothetical protein